MSEMVERAREIIANGCACDRGCERLPPLDVSCGCLNDAQKVIALLGEPTPQMLAAAWEKFKGARNLPIGPGPGFKEALGAMITAALSSEKE